MQIHCFCHFIYFYKCSHSIQRMCDRKKMASISMLPVGFARKSVEKSEGTNITDRQTKKCVSSLCGNFVPNIWFTTRNPFFACCINSIVDEARFTRMLNKRVSHTSTMPTLQKREKNLRFTMPSKVFVSFSLSFRRKFNSFAIAHQLHYSVRLSTRKKSSKKKIRFFIFVFDFKNFFVLYSSIDTFDPLHKF